MFGLETNFQKLVNSNCSRKYKKLCKKIKKTDGKIIHKLM